MASPGFSRHSIVGPGGVRPDVHDRNRGAQLPSVLSGDAYRRLQAATDPNRLRVRAARTFAASQAPAATAVPASSGLIGRRFASLEAVSAAGFHRVAQGFYQEPATVLSRVAHPIWELRSEDDGSYLLVRRREERAVDLRTAADAGGAGAVVAAGIIRQASRRQAAKYQVSLFQTPDGSTKSRRPIFHDEVMDEADLERLVSEIQMQPAVLTYDTWADGEWELRVRGPKGEHIHEFEASSPGELGGERGRALLESLRTVIPNESGLGDGGEGGLPPPTEEIIPGDEGLPPPPPELGVEEELGSIAPTSAALKRGSRVFVVKEGQVADAVVLMVHPQKDAVDVLFGGGGGPSTVPMDDVFLGDGSAELAGGGSGEDPFALFEEADGGGETAGEDEGGEFGGDEGALVEITADEFPATTEEAPRPFEVSAARKLAALVASLRTAVSFDEVHLGMAVEATRDFVTWYAEQAVRAGQVFKVEGMHNDVQSDEMHGYSGLSDPIPGGTKNDNLRIRLVGEQGKILVTLDELEFDFKAADVRVPLPRRPVERRWKPEPPLPEYEPGYEPTHIPEQTTVDEPRTRNTRRPR